MAHNTEHRSNNDSLIREKQEFLKRRYLELREKERREKEVLLDRLKKSTKGKDIFIANSK
jgi:hypothetical protein